MSGEDKWLKYAQLESRAREAFGDEVVQSPRSSWTDEQEEVFREQEKLQQIKVATARLSKQKVEKEGYLIRSKLIKEDKNRVCEYCNVYSFSIRDGYYATKFGCCFKCYIQYIEDREERWKEGWRPEKNDNDD